MEMNLFAIDVASKNVAIALQKKRMIVAYVKVVLIKGDYEIYKL